MTDFTRANVTAWADNMSMDQLSETLRVNKAVTSSTASKIEQNFWSTPARMGDSDTREVMEISLSAVRLVNHITFDVAKFPHDVHLECYDEDSRDWRPCLEGESPGDEPCTRTILDCNPPVLPPASAIEGENHPQHSFSGHWESCEFITRPVRFQRLRLVLYRNNRGRHPCNSFGTKVAFSLAVKALYCGYKVYSRDCVPAPQPVLTSYTEHTEFASTTDVLGSAVDYSIRVNKADNVLRGDSALVWRSEPQPNPWCVVNYYADVRDSSGSAQLLDRFFLDPLTDGANCNLYYSNDEPDADFKAPNDPLPSNVAVINGQVQPKPLTAENQPIGTVTYVDIDNSKISFIPGARWWFGASLRWKFRKGQNLLDHPIFDCGVFHIAMTQFGMRFATTYGDYFYVDCDDFDPATDFRFVTWYDDGRAYLRIRVNGKDYGGQNQLSVKLTNITVAKLRIAGFIGSAITYSHDFVLHNLVLKVDQLPDEPLLNNFLNSPNNYTIKPEFVHDDDGLTDNALLRYYPDFASADFPSGFRGGTPTRYDTMEWSPIARDYILRKGFLYFPPTKAKYWKLEFCGLTPQPYEVYVPIKKTARTYRTEMWMVPVYPPTLSTSISVKLPGISVQVAISSSINFRSSTSVSINSRGVSVKGYTSTSVRVVQNTSVSIRLAAVSWTWNFLPCHKPIYIPRFETKCVHEYEYIEVEQTTKTAFFVGLKSIQAYKVNYLSLNDTAQYTEMFTDTTNIAADSGWTLTEDHSLSSGEAKFAQAESKIFPSNRQVRAVQFATTQSAPTQLLPDDDFDDPEHVAWQNYGDGTLAPFATEDRIIGSILRVDRSSREPSWSELPGLFATWQAFIDQAMTWAGVENSGNPAQAQGGITSGPITTPPGGRIYAAARVVAPGPLSSPLYVQIVDDENGRVLSEAPQDVAANQITEWYTAYTVGEGGDVLAWRWRDFSTNRAYPTYTDAFQRANAPTLGSMDTKQAWLNNGTTYHSIVTNEAATTVAGQEDYVDAITPWGTFEMVVGTMGAGGIDNLFVLSPILMNDAGVVSYRGGRSPLPITSAINRAVVAGDDIRIDVLPTVQVPTNRRDASYPDVTSASYSLVVYLNGNWIKTIAHRLGARTRRGFLGKVGQKFRSFAWVPQNYGSLPGPVMWALPVTGMGSFDASRLTWTDSDTNAWAVTGSVDNANATTPGVLIFTSAGAQMAVDTKYWYGTLTAGVRHVASGTIGRHGMVLVLDADNRVYLDAAGNVMRDGINYGNLVPGGVADATVVQVQFMDTKNVDVTIRSSINSTTYPRMLVARVGAAVVGTHASAQLQTWTGTRRGLAGDIYDGTPGATIADFHTSFDSWGWAPDASNVQLDPKNPTWNEVTEKGTGTYDSVSHYLTLNTGRLRARVIQRSASIDVWDMDRLSLFSDPIVWAFSNDGGLNYYPAYDVRNDPYGVLLFPETIQVTAASAQATSGTSVGTPGQALRWRAVSYAPHAKISSLTIRPWYGGLLSGITHRAGVSAGGPNVMPYDHYPPMSEDARFQTWHHPIPQDWYWNFQVLSRSKDQVVPAPTVLLATDDLMTRYKSEQGA